MKYTIYYLAILFPYFLNATQPKQPQNPIIEQLMRIDEMRQQVLQALHQQSQGIIPQETVTQRLLRVHGHQPSEENISNFLMRVELQAILGISLDPMIKHTITMLSADITRLETENISNKSNFALRLKAEQETYESDTAMIQKNNQYLKEQINNYKTELEKYDQQIRMRDYEIYKLKSQLAKYSQESYP